MATFTDALATAMVLSSDDAFVVRVMDEQSPPAPRGKRRIAVSEMRNGDPASIAAATRMLNTADIAVIQHEYGIYGGPNGDEVLGILEGLTIPSLVVLHTVLAEPTPGQRRVLERVVALASATVVMTETARALLVDRYTVDPSTVTVIAHGVPMLPPAVPHLPHIRPVVLTWGLLGPGKGVEWGIRAFAELSDLRPRPRYVVLGQTHPKVLAQDGDAYRDRLHAIVASLKLAKSVTIDGRYLSSEGLARSILAADVVLLPYDSRTQVTSGVLAEAVAASKPVVATAFPHAVELLSTGAGTVVAHENPSAIAAAVRAILDEPGVADGMAQASRAISKETAWPAIGARYRRLAVRLHQTVAA
ncbi:MAG: glycosyltransferase [Demequinaceae bacterium]|nr:glycosyltransferase [Demequinaceae bacterium]